MLYLEMINHYFLLGQLIYSENLQYIGNGMRKMIEGKKNLDQM